jgi:hypothetical protein
MKYVTIDNGYNDAVYLIPNIVNHADFVRALGFDVMGVLGAGFVTPDLKCYGRSISLGVNSRPEDTELLRGQLGLKE